LNIGFLVFLFWVDLNWVRTTCGVAIPFTMDRILRPNCWENFAEINLIEVCAEIIVSHPPVTITLEHIVELFFKTFVIIPSLILVSELTGPLTLTPRISNSDKLKPVDFSDLLNTISMVEQDTRVAHSLLLVTILVFNGVGTSEKESLRVELLNVLPELSSFDGLGGLGSSEMELLRNTSGQIDESLVHLTSIEHLICAVELSVGLLHERNPELVVISAMSIQWGLALRVVGDSSINDDILPASILEELENCKTILDTIIDDKIL
jgi:hypothetical protein